MEIRGFEASDHLEVRRLADRLTEGVAPWRDADAVLRSVRRWVEGSTDAALIDGSDTEVFVAIDEDEDVAGFVSVTTKAHFTGQVDGYIGELVVAPNHERAGVGRRLVEAALAWARSRDLAFLTLETGAANRPALDFYAALGFQPEDVRLTVPTTAPD